MTDGACALGLLLGRMGGKEHPSSSRGPVCHGMLQVSPRYRHHGYYLVLLLLILN